jgi:hypothetical protein
MLSYKEVLLMLSGAGLMASCAPLSNITKPVTARVVYITKYHYLDQDGDGAVDNCLYINGNKQDNNQCYFHDYIQIGDTVRFRAANKRFVNLSADVATRNVILDSVNNKSVEDLKRIYTGKHISKTK